MQPNQMLVIFPLALFSYDFIYVHDELSGVMEISPWWGKKKSYIRNSQKMGFKQYLDAKTGSRIAW